MIRDMKRLRRWLSHALTIISLLLFPTVLVLWYLSYHAHHVMWMRSQVSQDGTHRRIDSFVYDRGQLSWSSQNGPAPGPDNDGILWSSYPRPGFSGDWYYGPLPDQQPVYDRSGLHIAAPCSGLTIVFGSVISLRLFKFVRRYRRRKANRCPSCGYDMRASPDRCPECGADALAPSPHRS